MYHFLFTPIKSMQKFSSLSLAPLLCVCHFKLKVDLFHIKVFLFLFPLLLISSCNSHFPLSQLTNDSDDDDEDDNVKCEKMLKSMSKRNEMGGGGNKGVLFKSAVWVWKKYFNSLLHPLATTLQRRAHEKKMLKKLE